MKEEVNSRVIFISIIKKRASKIVNSNLFKLLAMCAVYISFLMLLTSVSNIFTNSGFEASSTISLLGFSVDVKIAGLLKSAVVAIICIMLTAPLIAGIYSYIYNILCEKEAGFSDIFIWYSSLDRFFRSSMVGVLIVFVCILLFLASVGVLLALYYSGCLIYRGLAQNTIFLSIILIISVISLVFCTIRMTMYFFMFIPLIENRFETPLSCLFITRKTLSRFNFVCCKLFIELMISICLTLGIGIIYFIPKALTIQLLFFRGCEDLKYNEPKIPSEVMPKYDESINNIKKPNIIYSILKDLGLRS